MSDTTTVSFDENQQATFGCPAGKTLKIVSAKYGSTDCDNNPDNFPRVGKWVSSQIVNNQVNFTVTNETMHGDTCPGSIKTLNVIYKCKP